MFTPHPVSCVTCHVSPVTCHLSHVTCHMSPVTCHLTHVILIFCYQKKKILSGEASLWRVCYQRGLPRLVLSLNSKIRHYKLISPLDRNRQNRSKLPLHLIYRYELINSGLGLNLISYIVWFLFT